MPLEDLLRDRLTPAQFAAAMDPAEEVLALACAGSGKSRTSAYRIVRLVAEGADPTGIVAFTFTEKAADSMKLRVAEALNAAGFDATVLGAMYIGTIHSYCQTVLGQMDARYRQYDVLDENRLKLYLLSRFWQLGLNEIQAARAANGQRPGQFATIREISDAWKIMNDEMITLDQINDNDPVLGRVLRNISDRLDQDEFIDFSLMIRRVVDALGSDEADALRAISTLEHLIVDEYQDVNPSQERLIQELHQRSNTLFVVGDDDQAIYAWRGADVSNIVTFAQRFPGCASHTLPTNFRSTPSIVAAADAFAAAELGALRIVKNPNAQATPGPSDIRKIWFQARDEEADWVVERIQMLLGARYQEKNGTVRGLTPADFAILMRSTRSEERNGQPRHAPFTSRLNALGVPYSLDAGGGIFDRPEVLILRDSFELLRQGSPDRNTARTFFDTRILPSFGAAIFDEFAGTMADWGRRIHAPIGGARQRLFPQQLLYDLLKSFGLERSQFDSGTMQDLGVFSRILQDVEAVYLSIDSAGRFREILNFLQNVAETGYDSATEGVLRRPDAITVSTVHRVKGLEFPVTFVVDVEAGRFPSDRSSYSGWLPQQVIGGAVARGAYQSTANEEVRLFYTAITRAERFLYVTGSEALPGGLRRRRQSRFSLGLQHPDISDDRNGIPPGIEAAPPARRIDETVMPTTYSEIKAYLRCPRDYQYRTSFGFSPPIPEMFGFGKTVHTAVGKLHEIFAAVAPTGDEAEGVVEDVFHLKHVAASQDPVNRPGPYERAKDRAAEIVREYVEEFSDDFGQKRQVEVTFEIPVANAVIAGAIDLLLQVDEQNQIIDATVIDFKAMEGGDDPAANEELEWTDLSLQVQLYAKAAREILGENAETGAVHLLKDNQRVEVPVNAQALQAAIQNVEWAVQRVLASDFPMRPHQEKCAACDFRMICPKQPEAFGTATRPPQIFTPGGQEMVQAFREFEPGVVP